MCKNILLTDWLGSQHLIEIVQTSFTFKNREKVVKSGCFEKPLRWVDQFSFEMKEGYKVYCVKYWCFAKLLRGWYLFKT